MNRSLTKLLITRGRGSFGRNVGIVGGMALGACLFLLLLGASNGIQIRNTRSSWITDQKALSTYGGDDLALPSLRPDVVGFFHDTDTYKDDYLDRIVVAATTDSQVSVPGVTRIPRPGEYYVSPALDALMKKTPDNELRDRFPGTQIGLISENALNSPGSLVVILGANPESVAVHSKALLVTKFNQIPTNQMLSFQIIIALGAVSMLFPVVVFIGIVTQLGSAIREERFATLRLLGATPRDIAQLVAIETGGLSLAGTLLGVVLAWIVRPFAAKLSLAGGGFLTSDLEVSWKLTVLTVVGMAALAALVAFIKTYRNGTPPLGNTRQIIENRPRFWRIGMLIVSFALYCVPVIVKNRVMPQWFVLGSVIGGFLLIAVSIIVVGPLLTYATSRLISRRTRTASGLIAARHIAGHPGATFRSSSGLIIAVYMVSFFAGMMSAYVMPNLTFEKGVAPEDAVLAFLPYDLPSDTDARIISVQDNLRTVSGARETRVLYTLPVAPEQSKNGYSDLRTSVIAKCADTSVLNLPDCPGGKEYITVDTYRYLASDSGLRGEAAKPVDLSADQVSSLKPKFILVRTDGGRETVERVRTTLGALSYNAILPDTRSGLLFSVAMKRPIIELITLAYLGMFVSIIIAGLSLSVATIAAMIERHRVFGLLRLIGAPVRLLQSVVVQEALTPLLSGLVLSSGLGFVVAAITLKLMSDVESYDLGMPSPAYFLTIGLAVVVTVLVLLLSLRVVRRQTRAEVTRFE